MRNVNRELRPAEPTADPVYNVNHADQLRSQVDLCYWDYKTHAVNSARRDVGKQVAVLIRSTEGDMATHAELTRLVALQDNRLGDPSKIEALVRSLTFRAASSAHMAKPHDSMFTQQVQQPYVPPSDDDDHYESVFAADGTRRIVCTNCGDPGTDPKTAHSWPDCKRNCNHAGPGTSQAYITTGFPVSKPF